MSRSCHHNCSSFQQLLRFLRNWTLPEAIVTGLLLYLLFAYTPQLAPEANFFGPILEAIFPLFMILILFVVFCKVDFHRLRLERWHLWVCLFQLGLVALMVGVALLFRLDGKMLIVAPDDILGMKTLTKDVQKLNALYEKGYADAAAIKTFITD